MKTKIKNYEICNSTISNHLGATLTITKITKTLGFCEFLNKDGKIVFPITKNNNIWFGNYQGVHQWQFKEIKRKLSGRHNNKLSRTNHIEYKFFDCLSPGVQIDPGTGTGDDTGGGSPQN